MKALLILFLGSVVLTGCTSTRQPSAEDRALWDKDPAATSAAN
jgi:hypothetical protein